MDKARIIILEKYMRNLSDGINPIDGVAYSNDSILNNIAIKRCFADVSDILQIYSRSRTLDRRFKARFFVSDEEKKMIKISKEPIAISEFVYYINAVIISDFMKKIRATDITKWLLHLGYLKQIEHDGKVFRPATKKGISIGINPIPKTNSYGRNYEINMYDENAQKFIIDHLEDIADFSLI